METPMASQPLEQAAPAALAGKPSLRDRILDGELGGYLLLAPAALVLLALTVWPLLYSIGISFTDAHLGAPVAPSFIGLENYRRLIADPLFLGSLATTAKLLAIAVPLQLALGYLCATVFRAAAPFPGGRLLRTVFILPTMITPLCIALFWSYIFNPLFGIANALLTALHLPIGQWFTGTDSALPTLVVVYLWEWTPFTTLLLLAGLLSISPSIYEAARIDGARWWDISLRIDLPLIGRVMAVAAILSIVEVIRIFDLVYGTTQGGPGTATLTNAVAIYRIGFQDFDTGYAAATSLLILLVTIVIAQWLARSLAEETA